ncbi:hypothetical protein ANCCAN_03097 [Ancylostoma caninum]|uniref:Uncharacterized protein n=1 Tax=Ancylostoma caninum TaxID=29170 RepID=A0A368H5G8_ANCCA|nr:hypothetical protein ANCCAN_03097 [Ancylostoma caninum]
MNVIVEKLDSVELLPRYAHLKRPWLRPEITPKIFTSNGLRYQWMWAKSLVVRGLVNGTTIDDLLRFLDGQNCSFLATGDAVWQSLQRNRPLYTICLAKYGGAACSLFPTESEGPSHYRMEIGDARANRSLDELRAEPLVLYEWGSTLGLPASRWGYTVTTMAIHDNNAGQVYLVDMTGRGYTDTCGKSLSAAVDDTQWKGWADEDVAKVYQFYQLRAQGFGVANHELQNYVNKIIESRHSKKASLQNQFGFLLGKFEAKANLKYNSCRTPISCYPCESKLCTRFRVLGSRKVQFRAGEIFPEAAGEIYACIGCTAAQTFYCESILNGVISWAGEDLTTACHLVFPGPSDRKRIARAREIMETEMAANWNNFMASAIDEMEAVYLTERQFVDVRNRLKGRISGDLVLSAAAPGIIRPGEPLVDDISDVHRRPIMSKMDTVGELPKDFEEVPPVESEEDFDTSTPVGAGFNDPLPSKSEEAHAPKRDIGKIDSPEKDEDPPSTVPSSPEQREAGSPSLEKPKETSSGTHSAPQQSHSLHSFTLCSYTVLLLPVVNILYPQLWLG